MKSDLHWYTVRYKCVEYPVSIKGKTRKIFSFVSRKLCRVTSFSFPNNFPKGKVFHNFTKKMFNFYRRFLIYSCFVDVVIALHIVDECFLCFMVLYYLYRACSNCCRFYGRKHLPTIYSALIQVNLKLSNNKTEF